MIDDWCVLPGDCRDRLADLDADSIAAVVTDPPYELGFMGKKWDKSGVPYQAATWVAVLRVLKPGGHLLAFGGTRTYHRMVCAIEDAGFEIRDCLQWIYGSGFPKSLDVSKAIDREAGAERQIVAVDSTAAAKANKIRRGLSPFDSSLADGGFSHPEQIGTITAPATPAAEQWQGWGTALKPAYEPIVLARKPLVGTVAQNVQQYGTGAINVDACRVEATTVEGGSLAHNTHLRASVRRAVGDSIFGTSDTEQQFSMSALGRWPANILHDGSDEVVALFPSPHGAGSARNDQETQRQAEYQASAYHVGSNPNMLRHGDTGSAARFFYTAKASRSERGEGNTHPTVKPLALMRYLVRLITPPDGLVLDPFTGSGTTGIAAILEQKRFIGIELEAETAAKAERRIRARVDLPLFAESLAL